MKLDRLGPIVVAFLLGAGGMALAASFVQDEELAPASASVATAAHQLLLKDVGVWDAEVKFYMGGPDSVPAVSKAVETNEMIGDLWLLSRFEGDFGGAPFNGSALLGYDTEQERYVGVWVDNTSTHMATMVGDYDEVENTLTYDVESRNPVTGEPSQDTHILEYVDEDTRHFDMLVPSPTGGDELWRTMEVVYKRRK
jgi:hypothetical protein